MHSLLEQKIVQQFPKLFKLYKNPYMRYGFECGNGWFDLIVRACQDLSNFEVDITCIKEKFGYLNIYTQGVPSHDTEKVMSLTSKYALMSKTVCETCGKPGHIRSGSWLRCLCDECNNNGNTLKKLDTNDHLYKIVDNVIFVVDTKGSSVFTGPVEDFINLLSRSFNLIDSSKQEWISQ